MTDCELLWALNAVYDERGVWIWLGSANKNLRGNTPIDLLAAGHRAEVVREVERLSGGMG